MDGCSACVQGRPFIGDTRQDFVIHTDGFYRIPCLIGAFRSHGGHGVSLEPAMGVEQLGLADGSPVFIGPWHVGLGRVYADDGENAGHATGILRVDLFELGVGMGASENGAIEHLGQGDIRRIDGGAAHPFIGIHPGKGLADKTCFLPGFQRFPRLRGFGSRNPFQVILRFFRIGHDSPHFPRLSSAAWAIALTIWVYAPQRQILPAIPLRISSGSGAGLARSRPSAAII